jgi:hypothetical protein
MRVPLINSLAAQKSFNCQIPCDLSIFMLKSILDISLLLCLSKNVNIVLHLAILSNAKIIAHL